MALNLSSFIKGRLQAYDPSIDVTDGSQADVEIVQPIVARLGTQPFDLDTVTFIKQRIKENYDIDTEGDFEDLFINPLQTLVEPLVQEEQRIALGQSIANVGLISAEEVDDLAANSFEQRNEGSKATTFVRLYFPNPLNLTVTTDKAASTADGLNFFSPDNYEISSADMLLNREGFEYYADIFVQAENPGEAYNVEIGAINTYEDMRNPIRVTNRFKASGGKEADSDEQLLQRVEDGRIEQSLNVKRGAIARTRTLFPSIKALQMIGAGEIGMDRDILEGTADGLIYQTFKGLAFGTWLYFQTNSEFFDSTASVAVGDFVKFKTQLSTTVYKTKITNILFTAVNQYFIEVEENVPSIFGSAIVGVLYKEGVLTISKIPGGMLEATVPSGKIHIGGHNDLYVAPSDNIDQEVTVKNISDQEPFYATLAGQVVALDNKFFNSPFVDFLTLGVRIGDSLVIETGPVGTYEIMEVTNTYIRVNSIFNVTAANLRAKILKYVTVDIVEPKTIKVPYVGIVNDLNVVIGSNKFITGTNLLTYDVQKGDVIEIFSGPNKDTYTITDFDLLLGGTGPIVDKAAVFTEANIAYRVYTPQTGVTPPFVRIKTIELLDSANQSTGTVVPYGDLVDARISCDIDLPEPPKAVIDKKLFFLPDFYLFYPLPPDPSIPGPNIDARYTQQIESADGVVRRIGDFITNPIVEAEINIPPFMWNQKRNKVLALLSEEDLEFTADPLGTHFTSPLAKAKPGDLLTIDTSINADNYIIKDIRILQLWMKTSRGHAKIAVIELDRELPVDSVTNLISIINYGILQGSGITPFSFLDYFRIFEYAVEFDSISGFIEGVLLPRLVGTMGFLGFSIAPNSLRDLIYRTCFSSYKIGEAPKAEMDCYLKEPATIEIYTDPVTTNDNPLLSVTTFTELTDTTKNSIPKRAQILPFPPGQIFPQSFDELDLSQYDRSMSTEYPASEFIFHSEGESYGRLGVREGDILEFYEAINDLSARYKQTSSYLLITTAGSNIVSFIWPSIRNNMLPLEAGQILCIDSGPDVGTYLVTEVLQDTYPNYEVKLNKTLTHTTLTYPSLISFTGGTVTTGSNVLVDPVLPGTANVNDYISIFAAQNTNILTSGEDVEFVGTYKIVGLGLGFATLDRTVFFPDNPTVRWAAHTAPNTTLSDTSGGGKELSTQYVRARLYNSIKKVRNISFDWTFSPNPLDSTSVKQLLLNDSITTIGSTINFSHKSPYRIVRKGIRILSSTELQKNRVNGLYKFTLPVVVLGNTQEYAFEKGHPFKISGSYKIEGYRHLVDNDVLTFSDREIGRLRLPVAVLPVGSDYSKADYFNVGASNIKITYEASPTVEEVQQFFSSPLDRVACSNALVRHFLPVYPYIEFTYTGGKDTDDVCKDVIFYINTLVADDNQLRADKINDIAKKDLASQVTMPIELVALVHGIDRVIRTLRSENSIGILDAPIYKGVPKAIAFYPGKDVSKELIENIPDLEYIKATRQ